MANSPVDDLTFAPLPLRARGTLEILDVAVKIYKQYFWVLLGWSAIVGVGGRVPFLAPFLVPYIVGASVCCITGAVRGQPIRFKQCGQFSSPRYGPMLGAELLGGALFCLAILVLVIAVVIIGSGLVSVFEAQPWPIIAAFWLGFTLFCTLAGSTAFVWVNLAMVVACMEEDKRNSRALGRAFSLMNGYWIKVSALVTLLSLAMLAIFAILLVAGYLALDLTNLRDLVNGAQSDDFGQVVLFGSIFYALVVTLATPIFYVTLALFYLDLRVRKEALDIEWNAHQTVQPQAAPMQTTQLMQTSTPFAATVSPTVASQTMRLPDAEIASVPVSSNAPFDAAPDISPAPELAATPFVAPSAPTPLALEKAAPTQAAAIVCSQCGAASGAEQSFCMNCGARLRSPSSQ